MAFQIGICDDEKYQIRLNSIYLRELTKKNNWDMEIHGFMSADSVVRYLGKKSLDILFLDIDLGEESGIKLAEYLARTYPNIVVVFITGHREYALDAFEVEAEGYLVKPYDIYSLEKNVKRALERCEIINTRKKRELVITDEYLKKKICVEEITYVQKQFSKSVIYTRNKSYNVYESISSLEERLGVGFIRVNQSEIVAEKEIVGIEGNHVILKNGMRFSMGRSYKKNVINSFFIR